MKIELPALSRVLASVTEVSGSITRRGEEHRSHRHAPKVRSTASDSRVAAPGAGSGAATEYAVVQPPSELVADQRDRLTSPQIHRFVRILASSHPCGRRQVLRSRLICRQFL